MERTFAIIKPDAVENNQIGDIEAYLESAGLHIVALKMVHLTPEEAREFYSRWDLIFAAKIRSECSLYQYSSGAFELDVAKLGGSHV